MPVNIVSEFVAATMLAVAVVFVAGCSSGEWQKPADSSAPPPAAQPSPTGQAAQIPVPPAAAPSVAPERRKAEVGVGAQGQGYGTGAVATPIKALFNTKQRLVFEVEIPKAMQLYKAMNDNRAPKTHAQFMKDIIEDNHINLPALPPGQRYVYDPEKEELMVEKEK